MSSLFLLRSIDHYLHLIDVAKRMWRSRLKTPYTGTPAFPETPVSLRPESWPVIILVVESHTIGTNFEWIGLPNDVIIVLESVQYFAHIVEVHPLTRLGVSKRSTRGSDRFCGTRR